MKELWAKFKAKWLIPTFIIISMGLFTTTYLGYREYKHNLDALESANIRNEQLEVKEQAAMYILDSTNRALAKSKVQLDSLKVEHIVTQRELSKEKKTSIHLAQAVKQAKELKDTTAYYAACDSLSNQVETLTQKVSQDSVQTAQIITKYDEQLKGKDSIIAVKDRLYSQLRGDYTQNLKDFRVLGDDYKYISKKLKHSESTKKWIVIGGGAGILAALIAK